MIRRPAVVLVFAILGCRASTPAPVTPAGAGVTVSQPATPADSTPADSTRVAPIPAPETRDSAPSAPTAAPTPAQQRCQFVIDNVDREGTRVEVAPGVVNYFAGGNVRFRCANLPVRIASDSVASYQGTVIQFVGRVRYRDSTTEMTADFGTYLRDAEKWEARGNVRLDNLRNGSALRGPMLDYFRTARGLRDTTEMYADQRPTLTLPVRDSTGGNGAPYVVVADRIRLRGSDQLWGGGRVTIDREDLRGRGDSLQLDTAPRGDGALVGNAVVRRIAADSFELRGRRIDLGLDQRELRQVIARDSASLAGSDLTLTGDNIRLEIRQRTVGQTTAWGRGRRPLALSRDYEIRGDSLAFDTPDQVLEEIRAFRDAWLGAKPDSAGDRDWVAGDSVVASFTQRDSAGTKRPLLQRLQATGNGKALYRFTQQGQPRASFNYTKADLILVTMRLVGDSVQVDSVHARGGVEGLHLQPSVLRADTTAVRDSLRVPADTAIRPAGRRRG